MVLPSGMVFGLPAVSKVYVCLSYTIGAEEMVQVLTLPLDSDRPGQASSLLPAAVQMHSTTEVCNERDLGECSKMV